jgi:hypothetical protein
MLILLIILQKLLMDLNCFCHHNVERLHYKTNILAFWESQKHDKSDIYKLVNIVLAVPTTQVYSIYFTDNAYFVFSCKIFYFFFQVSVERSFSGIKFILSNLRTSLSANLLDAIMIVCSNTKFNKV